MPTVCVIGAGAAGLAAAQRLSERGADVVVIEARDRIGGRVWTLYPESLSVPVELGAEFLHGDTPELNELASNAGLRTVDIAGRRWTGAKGELRVMDDFWERLDGVMRRLSEKREPDRSFADALAHMRSLEASDRRLAVQYVEGFHAADTARISERSLAEGGSPRDDVRERRIGRVAEGYGRLMDALAQSALDRIRLGRIATDVRWRPGGARVSTTDAAGGSGEVIEARAVVVTIPLGVFQTPPGVRGGVRFDPPLRAKQRAAAQLVMGDVVRVALQLDEPFWVTEQFAKRIGDERFDTLSFLHSQTQRAVAFPVWWTQYPVRAPLLVAWRGGPPAKAMASRSRDDVVGAAIASLASLFAMSRRAIERHVVASFTHDWINDPFSRGAYSYAAVGGDTASRTMARPVEGTLFFAGEHADAEGRNGTVHGAMASGWKAADQVLRALE